MEVRGSSDRGGDPMAAMLQVVVVVEDDEETRQASDTVDFRVRAKTTPMQLISTAAATTQKDSTEKKTALAVAATAAVDLTNLFFLLRGDDTDTDTERHWDWTGGISVIFAFAALLSAAGLVLALHTTAVVSAARRRVLLVASAAALFVASAGTVLALVDAHRL